MKKKRAHILAIGSELLHGGRVDSNSVFLAEMLADCGIQVTKKIAVSDEQVEIQASLRSSCRHADVVIVTGGLGSTVDDCTREAVATVFDRPLAKHRKALQILKRQIEDRGRIVTPLLVKQAFMPSGATVMDNRVGTAPGFYLQEGKALVFVLPGVPREAREMMAQQVQPVLKRKLEATVVLWSHSFNTVGLPETEIQQLILPFLQGFSAMNLSLLASSKGVKVTLSCWLAKNPRSGHSQRTKNFSEGDTLIRKMRGVLDPWFFSEGDETMEMVVGRLLSSHRRTLALAESCTGGLVAHRLTEVAGSSAYLDRGLVTYSNKAKQELLGVSSALLRRHGAVSSQVAEAMAKGIRTKSHVDIGVGITGIAGPGGGTKTKPVGLVYMAIDGPHGCRSQRYQFWGDRAEIKFRSSQAALNMVRRYLLVTKG